MDWMGKAGLTAVIVAMLLVASMRFGGRGAGLLAGLPTVTGPALCWLAAEHGPDYAGQAAIGSVAACALCAWFALAYERASRYMGAVAALALAGAATLLPAPALQALSGHLGPALAVAALAAAAACALMPDVRVDAAAGLPSPGGRRGHDIVVTALVAGSVSGGVAWAAPAIGPFWAGVLASPPLIAAAIAVHEHLSGGQGTARRFLRGYAAGLIGRAAFAAGFAILVAPLGTPAATLVAAAAGCACVARSIGSRAMSGSRAGKASS